MASPQRARPAARRRWSIPLLQVAGVTIRVHVTFIALVVLVAMSASEVGESVAGAVGWLVALFACVVAHELSHALVARSKGIAVHEIDLLPIGGVSRLERIPESWRDERAIAIAGPIASVGVALVLFGIAATAGLPLLPPSLWDGPLLVRLGYVNLMLAGFNLLPAFPLDGGRVLRALLERDRSRLDATRQAASISRVLAAAMIGVGLFVDVWLVVIGVFVAVAGRAEEASVLVHAVLGPTPARAIAVPCPVALRADTTAGDAAHLTALRPQPAYPVFDAEGHLTGLVTPSGLRRCRPDVPLAEVASGSAVDAMVSLEEVARLVVDGPVAVTSGRRVLGVVTEDVLGDHLRRRLHEIET